MRDLEVLEKQIVPASHKQYGGIRLLPEFLNNEDALFGLFEKPRTTEGEAVKRKEVVLKEDMGFFDKFAKFAGEHPYISAGVLIGSLFGISFAANAYQSNKKAVDNYVNSGLSKAKAEISVGASGFFFGGGAPVAAVPVANVTAKATPQVTEKPFLMYDGIKIIGDEQFQKDVVMTLEFGKKYSSTDYEFIKKNTKKIDTWNVESDMGAAEGNTSVNSSTIRGYLERGYIKTVLWELAHESWHNNADISNNPKNNTEELANKRGGQAYDNLSYVNESEIDKFYQEFNFCNCLAQMYSAV